LQCGSYIFMDADYGRNLDRDGAPTKVFEPSLFVWATVLPLPGGGSGAPVTIS
jgi:3-hydroxy-D-aspartate aldolase